jgi:hypothetical protein
VASWFETAQGHLLAVRESIVRAGLLIAAHEGGRMNPGHCFCPGTQTLSRKASKSLLTQGWQQGSIKYAKRGYRDFANQDRN